MTIAGAASASLSRRLLRSLADVAPVLAGVLLLIAAASKTYTFFNHGSPSQSYRSVEVAFEWAAAAALLSGHWVTIARRLAIACFVIFAAISVYEMTLHRSSCGCFGEIPVKPIETLVFDLIVLTLLVLSEGYNGRDNKPQQPTRLRQMTAASVGISGVGLVFVSLFSHAANAHPVTPIASSSAAEKSPSVLEVSALWAEDHTAFMVDLGYVSPSSDRPFRIILPSIGPRDIRIKRTTVECSCTEITNAPNLFAGGRKTELNLLFHTPEHIGPYSKTIVFELHNLNPKSIEIHVTSRIGLPLSAENISLPESPPSGQNTGTRLLKIRNDGPLPIHLLYSTSDVPGCYAILIQQSLASGAVAVVPVRLPDHLPLGHLIHIQIHTDCPGQPELDDALR